ncbi:MAG TPA: PIG-L family deacetylase, partial [Acidimicrobiia bacterium]|nr:PIG-L family deacetylase [Acidimicrobiia bacterium]
AGARLSRLRFLDVVCVTDGAPHDMRDAAANGFASRDEYARARAGERERALAIAHILPAQIHDIGCIDQEASFGLSEITRHITNLLRQTRPEIVLTHPYEGGHPDHDATAFAVHHAVKQLAAAHDSAPTIVEFASYHWHDGAMRTGCFLPDPRLRVRTLSLGSDERELKTAMFACYGTQQDVLAQFSTDVERFRLAPAYDFTAPPHEGRLFYEWFDWRVDGREWRRLAERALVELGAPAAAC